MFVLTKPAGQPAAVPRFDAATAADLGHAGEPAARRGGRVPAASALGRLGDVVADPAAGGSLSNVRRPRPATCCSAGPAPAGPLAGCSPAAEATAAVTVNNVAPAVVVRADSSGAPGSSAYEATATDAGTARHVHLPWTITGGTAVGPARTRTFVIHPAGAGAVSVVLTVTDDDTGLVTTAVTQVEVVRARRPRTRSPSATPRPSVNGATIDLHGRDQPGGRVTASPGTTSICGRDHASRSNWSAGSATDIADRRAEGRLPGREQPGRLRPGRPVHRRHRPTTSDRRGRERHPGRRPRQRHRWPAATATTGTSGARQRRPADRAGHGGIDTIDYTLAFSPGHVQPGRDRRPAGGEPAAHRRRTRSRSTASSRT